MDYKILTKQFWFKSAFFLLFWNVCFTENFNRHDIWLLYDLILNLFTNKFYSAPLVSSSDNFLPRKKCLLIDWMNYEHCKPIPVMKTGFSLCSISHREKPVFITWGPCNENRFFPVWKYNTGKTLFWPCTQYWPCMGLQWSHQNMFARLCQQANCTKVNIDRW